MGRIGMSQEELRRVEVLARVKSKELKVVDAASLLDGDGCGDAAAVEVGGRAVEAATQAETVSPAARATAALWGVGADGRKFSRLVGGVGSGRLPDEHGGRRDQ